MLVTTDPRVLKEELRSGAAPVLLRCLDYKRGELEQFEALLSLTNLAGMEELKVLVDSGARDIGHLMFSDNEMVKRAATECLSNLVPAKKTMEIYRNPDRVKIWLAFARDFETDFETARAAAGGLAMACYDWEVKLALLQGDVWAALKELVETGNLEIMHRAFVIIREMLNGNEEVPDEEKFEGLREKVKKDAGEVLELMEVFRSNPDKMIGSLGEGAKPLIGIAGDILG